LCILWRTSFLSWCHVFVICYYENYFLVVACINVMFPEYKFVITWKALKCNQLVWALSHFLLQIKINLWLNFHGFKVFYDVERRANWSAYDDYCWYGNFSKTLLLDLLIFYAMVYYEGYVLVCIGSWNYILNRQT